MHYDETISPKGHVLIPGIHAVRETLSQQGGRLREIWIAKNKKSLRMKDLLSQAEHQGIPIFIKTDKELSSLLPGVNHQGIVGVGRPFRYTEINQIIQGGKKAEDHALVVAADHITDEGNLGSLIRTAAFFGAHGLILPKDRSATLSPSVLKRSSGAHVHLPIARVVNLARTLDLFNQEGYWVIGAAGESCVSIYRFDFRRDVVLALGNEERGLSWTVRKRCHELVGIPTLPRLASLNVSVAGGVILSEIVRQRRLERESAQGSCKEQPLNHSTKR